MFSYGKLGTNKKFGSTGSGLSLTFYEPEQDEHDELCLRLAQPAESVQLTQEPGPVLRPLPLQYKTFHSLSKRRGLKRSLLGFDIQNSVFRIRVSIMGDLLDLGRMDDADPDPRNITSSCSTYRLRWKSKHILKVKQFVLVFWLIKIFYLRKIIWRSFEIFLNICFS